MSQNRVLLWALSCALVFAAGFPFAAHASRALAAIPPGDAKAGADQEVLKMNAECNDAELRGDVAAMDNCETADFTPAIVEEHMHLRADNSGRIADVNNLVMTVWTKLQGKWREAAWIAVGLPGSRPAASEPK